MWLPFEGLFQCFLSSCPLRDIPILDNPVDWRDIQLQLLCASLAWLQVVAEAQP
jgi:hypothetical protein